jgi:hypothetical protein
LWQSRALTILREVVSYPERFDIFITQNYAWAKEHSWTAQAATLEQYLLAAGERTPILHLVLYNPDPYYTAMYHLSRAYYHQVQAFVRTVYYTCSPDVTVPVYDPATQILILPGTEQNRPGKIHGNPGTTAKTRAALAWALQEWGETYRTIVRSNVSTLVDFRVLEPLVRGEGVVYGGATLAFPEAGGEFVRGFGIVLSRSVAQTIVQHGDDLDVDTVDDVALAQFLQRRAPHCFPPTRMNDRVAYVSDYKRDRTALRACVRPDHVAFYRFKVQEQEQSYATDSSLSRITDIVQMQEVIEVLTGEYIPLPRTK